MSGVNGLLLDGCCCVPIGPCENDVDDFELQVTPTAVWEVNKADWVERFFVGDTYINVIANEPYAPPTECRYVDVETDNDCCGGVSGIENCCPTDPLDIICCNPGCNPLVGDCSYSSCLCTQCGGSWTACGGVQGNWLIPSNILNFLNVDGDATGVACCDCPGLYCSVNSPTNSECYADQQSLIPCPNLDQGYAMLFTGNATYSGSGLPYMCVTPCDNATISASNAVAFGSWSFSVAGRSGTLYFADGNVTYTKGKDVTECNTMMLVFHGSFGVCNSTATTRNCAATWGRKFSPATNLYAAGAFVVGRWYKIKVVGTTNFVAIGATLNIIGEIFQATGVGAGTGSAYLARNAVELAAAYIGSYELRCIQTESLWYDIPLVTAIQEGDAGDHTWTGIEEATYQASTLGDCECQPSFGGCGGNFTQGTCGTALSVDYPTCVNAYTDAISQISNLPAPPAFIVLQFA